MAGTHKFKGWKCSIGVMHPGPCPLYPTRFTRLKAWLKGKPLPK